MKDLISLGKLAVETGRKKGAEEIEVFLRKGKGVRITLENNDIKLAETSVSDGIGIRVFTKNKLGFASVNIFEEDRIMRAVETAVEISKGAVKDEYNTLPEPSDIDKVENLYDSKAEGFTTADALDKGVNLLRAAKDYDPRVSVDNGEFTTSISTKAIVTSKGMQLMENYSNFIYFIMGMAIDGEEVSSFDYEFEATRFIEEIEVEKIARSFAEKVVNSLGAEKTDSFKGTVLLHPAAASQLLAYPLTFCVNAVNVQKGRSRLANRLGEEIASSILTVEDNGLLASKTGSRSFDREGVAPKPMSIINEGRLENYLYNHYSALKDGKVSTGHAGGSTRSVPSISPTNLLFKAGDSTKDELIASIDKGILVTRFSGFPDPISGHFSGTVKGGFLIENGKITRPIKGTMIEGNTFEVLTKISGLSSETKLVDSTVLPYVQVEDVSVTSDR